MTQYTSPHEITLTLSCPFYRWQSWTWRDEVSCPRSHERSMAETMMIPLRHLPTLLKHSIPLMSVFALFQNGNQNICSVGMRTEVTDFKYMHTLIHYTIV